MIDRRVHTPRLLWVNRVGLTPRPLFPVHPNQRTSQDRPGWSVSCQKRKSGLLRIGRAARITGQEEA
jgi:hypothetical protein